MSGERRGIGRVSKRGTGRGTRGGGRARVRAMDNLGVNVRAAMDPRVDVRPVEDPRMEGVLRVLERIGNMMDRQAQERDHATAQATEAAAAVVNENAGVGGNQAPQEQVQLAGVRQMPQLVEQFIKLKPHQFNGRGDPETAPRWVESLEKTFKVLGCTDEEKVMLAVYQLQESAHDWWKATEGRVFPEGTAQTWAAFVESFYEKYFSENAQEKKLMEFMRLRQGQMTVDQYEAEFARLAKFAPTMVENPRDRARRFRDGLKPDFRSQILSHDIKDYGEMYRRAQIMEQDMTERAAASGSQHTLAGDNRQQGKRPMMEN